MANHRWIKSGELKEGKYTVKHYSCKRCGCVKHVGNRRWDVLQYIRSNSIFDHPPVCVEMGRRSNEPLD